MPEEIQISTADKLVTALLLTSVGGFVDAVGYISLFQIFTANMSGNSIHVGMYLGSFDVAELSRPACAIISYVSAIILTRITLEIARRAGVRRIASVTLSVEALLLVIFARATPVMHAGQVAEQRSLTYFLLVATLAFAMGVQTGTLTHLGALTVYTTFVTGTLTKFSESFSRVVFWLHDSRRGGNTMSDIVRHLRTQADAAASALLLGVWFSYVAGAALGTISKRHWQLKAIYAPVAVLAALVVLDRIRPLAAAEEQHQGTSLKQTG
jgi:uncharacterized membrane protein YoaK (UPF0700 family)